MTNLDIYNPTKVRGIVESLKRDLAALRKENEALRAVIAEYVDAFDCASDPTIIGSTCRLIRAESGLRDALLAKEERHE